MNLGIKTVGRSYSGIEVRAAAARSLFFPTLTVDAALPGIDLFESLETWSGRKRAVSYAVSDIEAEGMTLFDTEAQKIVIALSAGTYDALRLRDDPRARYTVGHEMGHADLHCELLEQLGDLHIDTTRALHRGRRAHERYEDTEWQANAYAGALLMPARGLAMLDDTCELDRWEVARRYRVSVSAADVRIEVFKKWKEKLLM